MAPFRLARKALTLLLTCAVLFSGIPVVFIPCDVNLSAGRLGRERLSEHPLRRGHKLLRYGFCIIRFVNDCHNLPDQALPAPEAMLAQQVGQCCAAEISSQIMR
ncbi:MAG TPA: hypothetical protein PLM06_11715 [Anaerolineae bacterium]|nr:hypothetical protein [Anaerolineae bacterium]